MSVFIADGPIAICDRCSTKVLARDRSPDRNAPGLMVCRQCNDAVDPYRLAWTPRDGEAAVHRPRPESPLERPSTMTTVDERGHVVEGELPTDLSVRPSSE